MEFFGFQSKIMSGSEIVQVDRNKFFFVFDKNFLFFFMTKILRISFSFCTFAFNCEIVNNDTTFSTMSPHNLVMREVY